MTGQNIYKIIETENFNKKLDKFFIPIKIYKYKKFIFFFSTYKRKKVEKSVQNKKFI